MSTSHLVDGRHHTNQESPDEGRDEVAARVAYGGQAPLVLGHHHTRGLLVHVADLGELVRIDLWVAVDAEEALGLGSERQAVHSENCEGDERLRLSIAKMSCPLVYIWIVY